MAGALSEASRALVISKIPGYDKLSDTDKIRSAVKVIADDFYLYCERNLMVLDKMTMEVVPLVPNWAQKSLIDDVLTDIENGVPVRYIILKARQLGFSTIIEALAIWWTTTHRNIKTSITAHEADASTNIYEMFKRYLDNLHPHFRPTQKYNNTQRLVFDVDDVTKQKHQEHVSSCTSPETCGTSHKTRGLGSSIKTSVAQEGKGRSSTTHFFHGSEVAFWKANADVVSSAIQAVPMAPLTFVFLESTANGVGGYFYDEWQAAKRGESNLKPRFYAWHQHNEYELPGTIDSYDDEELKLIRMFKKDGYPEDSWDRKLIWRRAKKKEFRSDPKKFYQEYPSTDMEAFLASGRPRFDLEQLQLMETLAISYKPMFGAIIKNPDNNSPERYVFQQAPPTGIDGLDPSPLKVWELVDKKEKYFIGVDVSEGIVNEDSNRKESDYSVIDVVRESDLKTVARWRGHIDPDLLGAVIFDIGTYYNNALVGVEVNNHGLTTVQSLRNKFYRNLYMRQTSEEQSFQTRTSLMGFRTDRKTKPLIVDNLATAIREGDIIDLDIVFIREAMSYVIDDQGRTNAQKGQFDDTVMAKAIALKMAGYDSLDSSQLRDRVNKPTERNYATTRNNQFAEIDGYVPIARSNGKSGAKKLRGKSQQAAQRRKEARKTHRHRKGIRRVNTW